MSIYTPYFYIIQDVRNGMYYAGAKWAKGANPDNFMVEGGYETSSETIKELIRQHGLNNFIVHKIKTFETGSEAYRYETRFLEKVNARNNLRFYNLHNNDGIMDPDKFKQASLLKYGVDNPAKSTAIKTKVIRKNNIKYGVDYPMQSKEIKAKRKQTLLDNYGVEWPMQSEEILEKRKQSLINSYNVENVFQLEDTKIKIKQTKKMKYNDENYNNQDGIANTMLDRYGVKHAMQSNEIKERRETKWKEMYGVSNPAKTEENRQAAKQRQLEKANRKIVLEIREIAKIKKIKLGKGWYLKSDEYLINLMKIVEEFKA